LKKSANGLSAEFCSDLFMQFPVCLLFVIYFFEIKIKPGPTADAERIINPGKRPSQKISFKLPATAFLRLNY
jgi:hypothetical protein